MSTFKVSLLGNFRVQHNEQVLNGFSARKAQELFAYLLLHRNQGFPRETLASLLWGHQDKDDAQLKRCLRQALWQLQSALESQATPLPNLLLVEPDWIQLNSSANLCLDVAMFEDASQLAQGLSGGALDLHAFHVLREAVNLYQGDLLEGWYQDWCRYERERLQSLYLALLDKLMDYCEAQPDYTQGLAYGARLLHHDRAHECTHRRLMRLHYLAGDRTAALRQYASCVTALAQELDVTPSPQTVTLYEQIRANGWVDTAAALAKANPNSASSISLLPEVLERLEHLQAALATAQRQIEQDTQAIAQALQANL